MPVFYSTPAPAEAIARLKAALAPKLPAAYEDFLRHDNGLFIDGNDWLDLDCAALSNAIAFQALFGLDAHNVHFDLEQVNTERQSELPAGFLIIGDDPGGNDYVLQLDSSAVFYRDRAMLHDDPPDLAVAAEGGGLYRVADSFVAFLAALCAGMQDMDFVAQEAWPQR